VGCVWWWGGEDGGGVCRGLGVRMEVAHQCVLVCCATCQQGQLSSIDRHYPLIDTLTCLQPPSTGMRNHEAFAAAKGAVEGALGVVGWVRLLSCVDSGLSGPCMWLGGVLACIVPSSVSFNTS